MPTYKITIHDIVESEPGKPLKVGPGRNVPNKTSTLKGAQQILRKHLDGDISRPPSNMGRLVEVEGDTDHWYFMGVEETTSHTFVDRRLVLCRQRRNPPQVVETVEAWS